MSQNSILENFSKLSLNGQPIIRNYSAEVLQTIQTSAAKTHSCTAILFSLHFLGNTPKNNLKYRLVVNKRLFLDEKGRPVFKPSKAQKIALAVAKINDDLVFEISKEYRLLSISNSDTIRLAWEAIRTSLLQMYPDLGELCSDFDWQLKEENIQNMFLTDNFYNFFFANIFYQEFENEHLPPSKKIIANGFENLNIPIIETRSISKHDMLFQNSTISTVAELDTLNEKFPLEKMNIILGRLIGEIGANHDLEFSYKGNYQLKPRIGLITGGSLEYDFKVPEIYQKTMSINFNLENDE